MPEVFSSQIDSDETTGLGELERHMTYYVYCARVVAGGALEPLKRPAEVTDQELSDVCRDKPEIFPPYLGELGTESVKLYFSWQDREPTK